jgi:hypothetical protein
LFSHKLFFHKHLISTYNSKSNIFFPNFRTGTLKHWNAERYATRKCRIRDLCTATR